MNDIFEKVSDATDFILNQTGLVGLDAAIVLGTGLGDLGNLLDSVHALPYKDIPHFCVSTVDGHKGRLLFGNYAGKRVVVMQGRFHYYEGYGLDQVTFPVRVFKALGAKLMILNSAAGGLNPSFKPGDVMIVTDHINLLGANPLRGFADPRLGDRFPDMSHAYDSEGIEQASKAILELGAPLRCGVYVAVPGPSLETPAETRMLRMLGADAVGMSSVPEIITATQVGLRSVFLVAITNVNDPQNMKPVALADVIQNANSTAPLIGKIIVHILTYLPL
ncbi:MAG: purine-nucleoside phosphorylase [Desulfomonilaceae bacterium]